MPVKNANTTRRGNVTRGGSFWYETIVEEQTELVSQLFNTASVGGLNCLELLCQKALPSAETDVYDVAIPFSEEDVIQWPSPNWRVQNSGVGDGEVIPRTMNKPELYQEVAVLTNDKESGKNVWKEESILNFTFPDRYWQASSGMEEPYIYKVIHTTGIIPSVLLGDHGLLFAGVDFEAGEGELVFKKHPILSFPNSVITVRHGKKTQAPITTYSSSADPSGSNNLAVVNYIRSHGSLLAFEAAINSVLGLDSFSAEDTITDSNVAEDGTVFYTCLSGNVVHIRQPHKVLENGKSVYLGMTPGKLVEVKSRVTHGNEWFKNSVGPYNGLPVFNILQKTDKAAILPGGERPMSIDGDYVLIDTGLEASANDAFNANIRKTTAPMVSSSLAEYLNSNYTETINLVEFLLENVWMDSGVLIMYTPDRLTNVDLEKLKDFIYRNKPINAVVFLIPNMNL